MKIGIIGCGLNSDYHINFALTYPGSEIVGLVDLDEKKAQKVADRFKITKIYKNIDSLVEESRPQVIHVVTPPRTHFQVAREALEKGCHVLVEKPLALNLEEAEALYNIAEKRGVKLCAMHNHFFDPCMVKARKLIDDGSLGKIINVESYYGLNTRIDAFRKYPQPDVLPWLYSLPGGVFHDFMAHPLYVMLPYVGRPREVKVMEKSFGELPQGISDELRILINGEKTFGSLTFSFAAKPHLHFLRIIGTRMVIHVDFNMMTTVVHPLSSLPKAAQKATYNLGESKQLFTSTVSNMVNFVRGKLKPYQGMQTLIHQFYDAIQGKGEVPVSKEEALMVIKTMDEIFNQVKNTRLTFETIIPKSPPVTKEGCPKILVTGASGFLGTRLVEMLVEKGYPVRALVRKLSNTRKLQELGVEIFFGDVGSLESIRPAFAGIEVVVHAAADTAGDAQDSERSTIQGTRNIIEASREVKAKKMVYISSCSVYGVVDYKTGEVVTEESPLERFSERRGYYSYGKLKAEEIVIQAMKNGVLPIVCLRPGTIFGPGGESYTPMMGFSLGTKLFAVIGNRKFILPLVYIDNLVEAILLAIEKDTGIGRIYNVVDSDGINKKEYIEILLRKLYPEASFLYIPYWFLHTAVFFQEILTTKIMKRRPFLTRYRLISSQRSILYDSSKIQKELGWNPAITLRDAMGKVLVYETAKCNH
jgi:predicted dehydrogenase/nucleoside-diphosphate-sugar epimerase